MRGDDIAANFPTVFTGLGNLGQPYHIQLKEGARPHAIYVTRPVLIPLRAKVKTESEEMEETGVIEKVEQITPWCTGMVVGPKKPGKVRICVEIKPLNENLPQEVYPIPKLDEKLAQLAAAIPLSKG